MKKDFLLRTNVFICIVIILGFALTSLISYHSNHGMFKRNTEQLSALTLDGIYHQIDSIFIKPINISSTIANDSLLKAFLAEEETRGNDAAFTQTMRDYLFGYKDKYGYDSVFLVSAKTNRYYHCDSGVDRILTRDTPENQWYYSFLEDSAEYRFNIENDEMRTANNEINIMLNCKILSSDKEVVGIVGIEFRVVTLQELFQKFEESFQIQTYLIDNAGTIEVSSDKTGYSDTDLFEIRAFRRYKENILANQDDMQSFWYSSEDTNGFLVSCYIPNLDWYLIIDNDTTALEHQLNRQFFLRMIVVMIVIGAVLLLIISMIHKYNAQMVSLTLEKEKTHHTAFQTETEKLYENIYELDITHNRAANEATENYFESLGIPRNMPYDKALYVVAEPQIKEEYREGYVSTFTPENVLRIFEEGQESLRYDFMNTNDSGSTYYWMRITARVFYWEEDASVRMLTYRQNIHSEKQQELIMIEKMQRDSLSSLYNKAATQELIRGLLMDQENKSYAFFILDIDEFKSVNDTCGHAFGDRVIEDFARRIKQQSREKDIVGRIGGDEFVVFVPISSKEWAELKAKTLSQALCYEFSDGQRSCLISASIGVAVSPQAGANFETLYQNADLALYQTKANGKNGYTLYQILNKAKES